MPCLLLLAVTLFPRIALAVIWFTSTYLQRAFHEQLLLPIAGLYFSAAHHAGVCVGN